MKNMATLRGFGRSARVLLLAGMLGVLLTLILTSRAEAHDYCIHQGYDWGCVKNNHHTFSACDAEGDGQWVYSEALYRNQYGYLSVGATVGDPDGRGGRCGVKTVGWTINYLRVCEYGPHAGGCLGGSRVLRIGSSSPNGGW
jgi:hypothetical protein